MEKTKGYIVVYTTKIFFIGRKTRETKNKSSLKIVYQNRFL